MREELQVFNLNEKLKDYNQQWKKHLEKIYMFLRVIWWTDVTNVAVSYTHLDVYKRQGTHFDLASTYQCM